MLREITIPYTFPVVISLYQFLMTLLLLFIQLAAIHSEFIDTFLYFRSRLWIQPVNATQTEHSSSKKNKRFTTQPA